MHLRAERIDGIDDIVIGVAIQELDHILILEEGFDDLELDLRIDGTKPLS